MDDYFGKIVVLAPTKEREMEFKIGDEVVCIDNSGLQYELTLGKCYAVTESFEMSGIYMINALNDEGSEASFYARRFELASEIEDSATPTEIMVEITQDEYDSLHDRIELLESLLVDANKRITELEAPVQVFNKPIEDYTFEDWRNAMAEHAIFETANGDELTLTRISEALGDTYPIETSRSSYTVKGYYYEGNYNPEYNIIRRIK